VVLPAPGPGCGHRKRWPVCKFDQIFVVPSVLTSITAHHLPLFQCIAAAFQMFVLSAGFIVPRELYYFVQWSTILSTAHPMMMLYPWAS